MANTKSAIKNARKTARRTLRNKAVKTRLKTLAKRVKSAQASGKGDEARSAAIAYVSALDKAAKKKVIHRNAASRHKSHLSGVILAKS